MHCSTASMHAQRQDARADQDGRMPTDGDDLLLVRQKIPIDGRGAGRHAGQRPHGTTSLPQRELTNVAIEVASECSPLKTL